MAQSEADDIKAISGNTIVAHGRKMEYNCLRNLTAIARSHGVKDLRNQFKGYPAVVCGAGPSLDAALPLLKAHQGQYLLIAADRALKPLLAAGLVPHIVCTSDMDKELIDLFSGFRIPESVILLYDRDCYWELPAAWIGPLMTYDTYFDTGIWESTFMGHKGFLCKNFTVSHTALYVAQMMGASPILLCGVDFAYPSRDNHHATGVSVNEKEPDELHRAHWLKVPGNVLPEVDTTEVFSIAIPAMKNQLQELRVKCWNTSEVGAAIPNAPYMPLVKALEAYGKGEDYQDRIDTLLAANPPAFDRDLFDRHTAHVLAAMRKLHDQAVEGIEIMKRLKKLDIMNSTERPKWGRVFLKGNQLLMTMQKDLFSQYLLQRPMLASTRKTAEMLKAVQHLKPDSNERLQVEANRHSVFFWQQGVCCKIFVDALYAVRKELLESPSEVLSAGKT